MHRDDDDDDKDDDDEDEDTNQALCVYTEGATSHVPRIMIGSIPSPSQTMPQSIHTSYLPVYRAAQKPGSLSICTSSHSHQIMHSCTSAGAYQLTILPASIPVKRVKFFARRSPCPIWWSNALFLDYIMAIYKRSVY
jgi:hypothetical protein